MSDNMLPLDLRKVIAHCDAEAAALGCTCGDNTIITITATPNDAYQLNRIHVTHPQGHDCPLAEPGETTVLSQL